MNDTSWLLEGSTKDPQSVMPNWQPVDQTLIDGVALKEVAHVIPGNGVMTELYRRDWNLDPGGVEHVFARTIHPGGISAWHGHALTTDRLFVLGGYARIALYDSRPESPTLGMVNDFRISYLRPSLLIVPAKVWHAVQNIGAEPLLLINMVSRAYQYEDPDHWRLPEDSPAIPFKF